MAKKDKHDKQDKTQPNTVLEALVGKRTAAPKPTGNITELFAKELGLKVATDVLSSDVAYWYPINCAPIDIVFGGGIPSGKIIEMYGPESTGKSTNALEFSKAFTDYWRSQGNDDYVVLWIESESALDKIRAQYMGCQIDRFIISEAETVEDGFEVIYNTLEKAQKYRIKLFIVWDTIAAIPTKNEKVAGTNTGGMAEKPRIIRQELRKIVTPLGFTNSTMIFCNQIYKNLQPFAEDESPGGGGIKFHASIRARLKVTSQSKDGTKITGINTEIYTKKNKLTMPYQRINVVINSEKGLDRLDTTLQFLIANKCIQQKEGGVKIISVGDNEYKFQNLGQLSDMISDDAKIKTTMDYLCYLHYSKSSPLMKVKLLEHVWKYEISLFGQKVTKISDEEFALASQLYSTFIEEQDRDV